MFTIVGVLFLLSSWGIGYSSQAMNRTSEVETKVEKQIDQYGYITEQLKEIKVEQQNQRKLIEQILTNK